MKQPRIQFVIESDAEVRVDKYLADQLTEISRSQIRRLIDGGFVTLNGVVVKKAGTKVKLGDELEILVMIEKDAGLVPEQIPLNIIFENEQIIVINKPAGMVVHPGVGNHAGTLVNALLAYYPPIRDVGTGERPGVVHRLDKETSGVIVFAKTEKAYRWLVKQFKSREAHKAYLALVDGHPPTPTGRIEAPIGRDSRTRTRMAVKLRGQGKPAITEYFQLQKFNQHSLLEVHPITGRTHQIRVHLSYLGAPVVGDTLYGRRHPSITLDRIFLHARTLKLRLPGERNERVFEAPLPDDLQLALTDLQAYEEHL
ncbi:MAG: RluA family pseudouridine synthase [Chloroflexi bacterium]|nr:RluA family pseudouridine synthase [Chloroflexota bacterium]